MRQFENKNNLKAIFSIKKLSLTNQGFKQFYFPSSNFQIVKSSRSLNPSVI